ncbi:MAG TPA: hypothetical protein VF070_15460 [Streptosporangiaceae bacterium]
MTIGLRALHGRSPGRAHCSLCSPACGSFRSIMDCSLDILITDLGADPHAIVAMIAGRHSAKAGFWDLRAAGIVVGTARLVRARHRGRSSRSGSCPAFPRPRGPPRT